MKSSLLITALCSFQFLGASEKAPECEAPRCSAFTSLFIDTKANIMNLNSAVEAGDYCKTKWILQGNYLKVNDVARVYFASKILSPGFNFKDLPEKSLERELVDAVRNSNDALLSGMIMSAATYAVKDNPTFTARNILVGRSEAGQMRELLEKEARKAIKHEEALLLSGMIGTLAGFKIGRTFANTKDMSKEDKCRSMIEFFEKAGYSAKLKEKFPHRVVSGARGGFGSYCDIEGYFAAKK